MADRQLEPLIVARVNKRGMGSTGTIVEAMHASRVVEAIYMYDVMPRWWKRWQVHRLRERVRYTINRPAPGDLETLVDAVDDGPR